MMFKLNLCQDCAAKLRGILRDKGEKAMAKAIGRVLCAECMKGVPGYQPGHRLTTALKSTPPRGIGEG